jgi:hypothetical protein
VLSASYKHCGKSFPPASDRCIIFNLLSLQLANFRAFTIWICVHEDCGDLPPCHLLHDRCQRRLFVLPFQPCEIAAGYTTSEYYLYRRRRGRTGDASLKVLKLGMKIFHVTYSVLYLRSSIHGLSLGSMVARFDLNQNDQPISPAIFMIILEVQLAFAKNPKAARRDAGRRVRSWSAA